VALRRAVLVKKRPSRNLLGAGVFGDGLGTFRDGVLGQLSGEKKTDGRLDFAARDGRALVVVGQTRRLTGDALEDVVDERVHDGHGLGGDASVGVDLLQHFVNVDGIALLPLPLLLLVALGDVLGSLTGLLGCFTTNFRRHFDDSESNVRMNSTKLEDPFIYGISPSVVGKREPRDESVMGTRRAKLQQRREQMAGEGRRSRPSNRLFFIMATQ